MTSRDEALRALEKRWREEADKTGAPTKSGAVLVTNEDRGYSNALYSAADELAAILSARQEVAPVAVYHGRRLTPEGTREFWGVLNSDAEPPIGAPLYTSPAHTSEARDGASILAWAVERWHAEVAQRPLATVHRRSLDDCWRQVVRRCGEDDVVLLGPRHDDLVAAMRQEAE